MLGKRVIDGLKWTAGIKLAGQVLSWAITIVVVRLLTPGDYGLLAYATVFLGFLALVAELGLADAVVQGRAADLTQLRAVFGAVILMNVALALLVAFALAPLAALFFSEPRLIPVMQVLGLAFLINCFAVIPTASLERNLVFRGRSVVELGAGLTGNLLTLALALHGAGVWSLVWGNLATALCRTLGMNIISPFAHWPDFHISRAFRLISFGAKVALNRVLWFVYTQADVFVAGKVLGKAPLGYYSVAMHLASMPAQRVSAIINQVAFPAFSRAAQEAGSVGRYLLLAVRSISFIAFPVTWGLASVAPEIVRVLLGAAWTDATTPLALLSLVMPLRILSPVTHGALQAIGRPEVSVNNNILACCVMPIAFLVGAQYGLLGLSLAWVLCFPLVVLANLARSLPLLETRLPAYLSALVRPAAISAAMIGAVTLGRSLISLPQLPLMLVLISIGVATYAVLSLLFNRAGCREVLRLLRK
jgi:teichuronic acid exporter